jgi:hypothetical protein
MTPQVFTKETHDEPGGDPGKAGEIMDAEGEIVLVLTRGDGWGLRVALEFARLNSPSQSARRAATEAMNSLDEAERELLELDAAELDAAEMDEREQAGFELIP